MIAFKKLICFSKYIVSLYNMGRTIFKNWTILHLINCIR